MGFIVSGILLLLGIVFWILVSGVIGGILVALGFFAALVGLFAIGSEYDVRYYDGEKYYDDPPL